MGQIPAKRQGPATRSKPDSQFRAVRDRETNCHVHPRATWRQPRPSAQHHRGTPPPDKLLVSRQEVPQPDEKEFELAPTARYPSGVTPSQDESCSPATLS